MALIKKDKTQDELKKVCLEQLEVFLVAETNSFVDKLFESLINKSYLINNNLVNNNERSRSPKSRNVPAPSGSSRRYQQQQDKYHQNVARSPLHQKQSPSRSPNRKRRSRSRSLGKNNYKRNRSRSPGQQQDNYNKMRRCRDYDEKGYCMRGNLCSFDHGVNPLVLDSVNANSVLCLTSSSNNTNTPTTASNNSNNNNNILLPTPNNQYLNNKQSTIASLTEPYNPEAPAINQNFQSSLQYRPTINNNVNNDNKNGPINKNNVYVSTRLNQPSNEDEQQQQYTNNNYNKKLNNPHFSKPHQNRSQFRPNNKRNKSLIDSLDKTTLEVRKIPSNLNTITNLNSHFSKFGTITNLKIGYDNDLEAALIEFASNAEALAAYRSTEAVLNNRFIKVFWHNSSNSINNINSNISSTTADKLNCNLDGDKLDFEKKLSIKERLNVLTEKQASITNNAVNNLINSGLINSNTPNQLASLIMGNSSVSNKLINKTTLPSKPVFNPALLRKQYTVPAANTPSSSNNLSANSTTSAPTTTNSKTISTNSQQTTATTAVTSTVKLISHPVSSIIKSQSSKEKLVKKIELQKKRQEMLSVSIQQNRLLIEKLEKSKNDAEKQIIRETITTLTKQIKQLEDDIKKENSLLKEETILQKQLAVS